MKAVLQEIVNRRVKSALNLGASQAKRDMLFGLGRLCKRYSDSLGRLDSSRCRF
jgi:hypothetical protein